MAGQVKVAVVSGAISSSGTGTADFTKSGFGTPKACIVLLSFDTADDTVVAAESTESIGFSDFTNHRCITHQDEDGAAKVDSDARKSATKTYVLLDIPNAAVDIDGTASTIADGVRLTNTTNISASAVFATVIMFSGTDLQVSLDSVALGNGVDLTTVVTTSIPQDLVFFIGTDISGEDSSSSGINNSFGLADISNDQATIVNRCMGWASDHNNTVGSPASVIRNDRCLKMLTETAGDDWGLELTAATTTSYTVTTRDISPGASMEVYALALNLDDRGSKIGSVDSPTSGATWTPSVALGFTPQYVGLGVTHAEVEGTIESDADAGGLGISSNTGAGEETFHGWYNDDGGPNADTANNFRSRVLDLRNDDTSVIVHDHSHLSFDASGWTYTINTENEAIARKWFYWAIEEASAATNVNADVVNMLLPEQAATLKTDISLTASAASLGLTKFNPALATDISFTAGTNSVTLSTQAATVSLGVIIDALTKALTLTVPSATVLTDTSFTASSAAITVVTQQATVVLGIQVNPTSVAVTISPQPVSLATDISFTPGVDSLTLLAQSTSLNIQKAVAAALQSISLVGFSASLNIAKLIASQAASIGLSEFAATVDATLAAIPVFVELQSVRSLNSFSPESINRVSRLLIEHFTIK